MGNHSKYQAGGTLLGLIIGLIIGLLIAVVVAMTIKNTPLPFTNKLGKPDKQSSPAAGQINDPNKSLYGNKDAVREAAKDVQRKAEETKSADQAANEARDAAKAAMPKPDAKPDLKADTKANAKTDGKAPIVDKSANDPSNTDKTKKADNADEKFTYFLQAGAFLEQADAENAKAKLALMGMSAAISERQSDNRTLYRVRIGPFAQQETMNRVRSKLTDNGVDVAVIRVPK